MRFFVSLSLALLPTIAAADALSDLRASLTRLPATTPVKGTFDVTSTSRSDDDTKADPGKATVGFEISETGLRIVYPQAILTQAHQEARGRAVDPERSTPIRTGMREVRALHIAELLDAASALTVLLESAQLVESKSANYHGKPARLVVLKLAPKMSKAASKRVKKLDGTLSVWLSEDGTPIAAEQSIYIKASFLLMSFENNQKQNWTFIRAGDRLVATRYEETGKSDGLGQHSNSQTTETITLE